MALPVNIDDLVNHRKVEWARIEYKEGWNPEKVLHTLCAFADPVTLSSTVPVPYQYRTSTVPVADPVRAPVRKLLSALKNGPLSPSELRTAIGIQHRQTFRENYLNPAIRADLIYAEEGLSPHDPRIRYALTDKGKWAVSNDTDVANSQTEVIGKISEVGVKEPEVGVVSSEVVVNPDLEVLLGSYRAVFRANASKVLTALTEHPEMDFVRLAKMLNISENSVWRAVRALKDVGLLVREGATRGSKWIVKKVSVPQGEKST